MSGHIRIHKQQMPTSPVDAACFFRSKVPTDAASIKSGEIHMLAAFEDVRTFVKSQVVNSLNPHFGGEITIDPHV